MEYIEIGVDLRDLADSLASSQHREVLADFILRIDEMIMDYEFTPRIDIRLQKTLSEE